MKNSFIRSKYCYLEPGGWATLSGDQVYMCPPGNRYNQENFALVIGKNKKNFKILPLKRVKFEIYAWVIG